jgi:hypothetical protein
MFGNNNKKTISSEQLDELLTPLMERIDKLEMASKQQARQIAALEQQLKDVRQSINGVDDKGAQPKESPVAKGGSVELGETIQMPVDHDTHPSSDKQTWYLPAPSPEGVFTDGAQSEQVGKSIYQLQTEDGINGQFVMLDTPDAIATAMISVSQFVKPVCKIEGNTHRLPKQIKTIEEGVAQKDGNVWRVVRKAKVAFL